MWLKNGYKIVYMICSNLYKKYICIEKTRNNFAKMLFLGGDIL